MTAVSRRTAELALVALQAAIATERRNGRSMPAEIRRALDELHAAATAPLSFERQNVTPVAVAGHRWLTAQAVADRTGVNVRTVQRKAKRGRIPAQRAGRTWLIEWEEPHG